MPDGRITAAQAIKRECRFCSSGPQSECATKVCKLHPEVFTCRSSVKRIKAHCLDCAAVDLGETVHKAVKNCTGRLLRENGNGKTCWLHPYRFGKNPQRRKRTSVSSKLGSAAPARHQKTVLKGTISPGVRG